MAAADVTVVMVTSPFASMPCTSIVSYALASLALVEGLAEAPVLIIMDGCRVGPEVRTKKGRVTEDMLALYDQYQEALEQQFRPPQFRILRSAAHLGFAHAVKLGLENVSTTYALVAQHDRTFCAPFSRLGDLLTALAQHEHIRYIGFPTGNNVTHDRCIHARYRLGLLNHPDVKLDLGDQLYLQPLVFWFDSQHLCHVRRYLQIFQPMRHLPPALRTVLGLGAVRDMLLRPGDFIEDKFGQAQRNALAGLRAAGHPDELVREAFRWFGSYLCWVSADEHPFNAELAAGKAQTLLMVSHLDGRRFDLDKTREFAEHYDQRFKNKAYTRLRRREQQVDASVDPDASAKPDDPLFPPTAPTGSPNPSSAPQQRQQPRAVATPELCGGH